jgi:hypothetical protein
MGGATLGPEGLRCPSVGECQNWKEGVGELVGEQPHRGRGRMYWIGVSGEET